MWLLCIVSPHKESVPCGYCVLYHHTKRVFHVATVYCITTQRKWCCSQQSMWAAKMSPCTKFNVYNTVYSHTLLRNCWFYLHTEIPKCTVMNCLKLQCTLVWKYESSWTRKGWPTARMSTSFSTTETCPLGTIFTAKNSLLDLWPPFDFLVASTTWPNPPLPRYWRNSYSPYSTPVWWPVTQPFEQIYQITVYILLTVLLGKRTLNNKHYCSKYNTLTQHKHSRK